MGKFRYYGLTKQLTQTTNPENGTVQYEYDSQQRMWRKTDAKGQKVQYTFDSYNRVVEVNRYPVPGTVADPCQKTTYTYDINVVEPYFAQNTWGRVAMAEWGGTGCPGGTKFQEMYSYTAAGLVTKKRLRAARVVMDVTRSADLDLAYTYDYAGRLQTMKYPDTYREEPPSSAPRLAAGALMTYTYNTLGQPVRMQQGAADVVSTAEYNMAGQMTRMVYNNGVAANGDADLQRAPAVERDQLEWGAVGAVRILECCGPQRQQRTGAEDDCLERADHVSVRLAEAADCGDEHATVERDVHL